MATIVLGSLGAAVGGALGGSVLGLSSAVIGRAVGATLGRVVDQRVMGGGSDAVEVGRVDRLRLTTAAEGAPIPRIVGRYRLGAQVIWAGPFEEHRSTSGGGKGGPPKPKTTTLSYTTSVALALCEGEIARVGRIWADGQEIARDGIEMRVYPGSEDQLPDPLIAAMEEDAPAYRGVAYVVIENLDLTPYGSRVPQFSFEVVRPVRTGPGDVPGPADLVRGVAVIPGTGEYALATEVVTERRGFGRYRDVNASGPSGEADMVASLRTLTEEVSSLKAASLVVSWFGDDLRAGDCTLRPMVEHHEGDPAEHPWRVAGLARTEASIVPQQDGRVVYGGTPTDASVVQSIRAMAAEGLDVTFYPFILMTPLAGNGLPDPWGGDEQPALPWRGRITCSIAPGREGTVDGTAVAEAEVSAFFGTASADDFAVDGEVVTYSGPEEWSYRRFILHYAALCAAAGGVEAFCIGSEMRSLTQVRGADGGFPAVAALRALAAEVKALLPEAKIGYAADWSEYFGYQPPEGGLLYHLDPLWADPSIDFVGIDNYMPLSDWRSGDDHADAAWGSVHDLDYLRSNVEGGEGYDWYYPTDEARDAQRREPIEDGAYGEPWVWRYKDMRAWWGNTHHDRPGGVRDDRSTAWLPGMKPIRFTEYGCPAVDLGTNQPNVFHDPKSSESALPRYSTGARDDALQMQYLRALTSYWEAPGRMPASPLDGRAMLDLDHSLVWAWDARPFPQFPADGARWADAENWSKGHWWSGRSSAQPLSGVIAEICREAGVTAFDVSRVHGVVRGAGMRDVATARSDLQSVLIAHGVEAAERHGVLVFSMRANPSRASVDPERLVREDGVTVSRERAPDADLAGRIRVHHVDADGDFDVRIGEAVRAGEAAVPVQDSEYDVALTRAEGQGLAERLLTASRLSRDRIDLTLPPSRRDVAAGTVIAVEGATWRVDRVVDGFGQKVEAVRTDPAVHGGPLPDVPSTGAGSSSMTDGLAELLVLDLPLLRGDEVPHAPHVAAAAEPWSGTVAVLGSPTGQDWVVDATLESPVRAGTSASALVGAPAGVWDEGPALIVDLIGGGLESASVEGVLEGANAIAIGSGASDDWEIVQFRDAELVGRGRWALRGRLRGQRGTEDAIAATRPVGSTVVVLSDLDVQLPIGPEQVGRVRRLRYGPGNRAVDDVRYREVAVTPIGRGALPYAPAHLRAVRDRDDWRLSWVRRTRLGGDRWREGEVPLGEASERYRVRIVDGGAARSFDVTEPTAVVPVADAAVGAVVEVAQVSDGAGAGIAARVTLA